MIIKLINVFINLRIYESQEANEVGVVKIGLPLLIPLVSFLLLFDKPRVVTQGGWRENELGFHW